VRKRKVGLPGHGKTNDWALNLKFKNFYVFFTSVIKKMFLKLIMILWNILR
jgi:hypothetical protein